MKTLIRKILKEEIYHPGNYDISHKGKLNFIDRLTDIMIDDTHIEDVPRERNYYVEGLQRIIFFRSESGNHMDYEEGVIYPNDSWKNFIRSYQKDTLSATQKVVEKYAGDVDYITVIYIWNEYLYKLREKYFGGGTDGPLIDL